MAKPTRIDDIKGPDKVTPSATGRPIIVGNQPTLTKDPMMAPADTGKKDEPAGETLTHAKIIAPVTPVTVDPPAAETPPAEPTASESTPDAEPDTAEISGASGTPAIAIRESKEEDPDPEAAATAEEVAVAEAKLKRDTELETIIESGKYAVPINAVQRKRSHMATLLLCVLAVVLLAALLDVVADVGIIKPPSSVPHTHFFSKH